MDPVYTTRFLAEFERSICDHNIPSTNRAALRSIFDSLIRGDFEDFGRQLTDDAELEIVGAGPMDGHWKGRADIVAAARANFAQVSEQKPEIECMISHGDCAAVLFKEQGIRLADGRGYRVRATQWFRFAGGKVRRIDELVAAEPD